MQSLISVGMEAYANRTMDKMSDGECQRVMIARALAQDTPITVSYTHLGLFITNEGNFQYSNATLSYYDPATCEVENEVFYRANGFKLGQTASPSVENGKETISIPIRSRHFYTI